MGAFSLIVVINLLNRFVMVTAEGDVVGKKAQIELPLPESLQAFTREQVKSLIGYFSHKHDEKFEACELGEKYQVLERYLHALGGDDEQYQQFLSDFRLWRNKQKKIDAEKYETNAVEEPPSKESILALPQVDETWSI